MMMQANDPTYITSSASTNPYSSSCGNTHHMPACHSASQPTNVQPSQPILDHQLHFDEFNLFHDNSTETHGVFVDSKSEAQCKGVEAVKPGKKDMVAPHNFTTGMPVLDISAHPQSHGEPLTESTALVDWYRQIITGLSEENAQLSSQLHEAKREIMRLKSNNPYSADGPHVDPTASFQDGHFAGHGQPAQFPHDGAQPHGQHSIAQWSQRAAEASGATGYGMQAFSDHIHHPQNLSRNPFHAGVQRSGSFGRTNSEGVMSSSDDGSGLGTDGYKRPCYWTHAEHQRFLEALAIYKGQRTGGKTATEGEQGGDGVGKTKNGKVSVGLGQGIAELIAAHVRTRTVAQVRSHAQKYFLKESKKAKAKEGDKKKKKEEQKTASAPGAAEGAAPAPQEPAAAADQPQVTQAGQA